MLACPCNCCNVDFQHISITSLQFLSKNLLGIVEYNVCRPADCRNENLTPVIFICVYSVIIYMCIQCTVTGTVYLELRYPNY